MNEYNEFSPKPIDAAYIVALTELVNACRAYHVEIDRVSHFQNGFHVTFKGFTNADAICHDHSYGSPCYGGILDDRAHKNDWTIEDVQWETIGFPWDGNDVSVHSSIELAAMISAVNHGNDWRTCEDNQEHNTYGQITAYEWEDCEGE